MLRTDADPTIPQILNGTVVQDTICNFQEVLSVTDSTLAMTTLSSRAFTTVLGNASNVNGWLDWLSNNLNVDAMNTVGLDGAAVLAQVKNDTGST